jgi:hypothetical protein
MNDHATTATDCTCGSSPEPCEACCRRREEPRDREDDADVADSGRRFGGWAE